MTSTEYLLKKVQEQIKLSGNPLEDFRADKWNIREWKEIEKEISQRHHKLFKLKLKELGK